MEFLPLFFRVDASRALVFGDGPAAHRKVEVLNKAGCQIDWVAGNVNNLPEHLAHPEKVRCLAEAEDQHWEAADLVVAANADAVLDAQIASRAKQARIPVNVVNQADLSSFVFPSIIDRSPILAAVSSSGELPVLTRLLRNRLESSIPHAFGRMAVIAKQYRAQVKQRISNINSRRRFWERHLEGHFAELVFSGKEQEAMRLLEDSIERDESDRLEPGEVYLVGAGPGDPDLLTFKALRLIRQADVVLYDRLVAPEIMNLVRQDAEKVNVGKERSRHTMPQQSINELLVHYARKGHRVLRLKGGDPFIFGRGGEEIETLAEQKIAFQVVPGITAASGCSTYSGIPLTHRDYAQSVRFITGHLKDDSHNLPWNELVHTHQTLVFYMGLSALDTICQQLIKHGMSPDMPAALISKGTTAEQKVLVGNVANLYQKYSQSDLRAPTIIIVGEVVRLHEKLNWREQDER
ncbi:MAG: uroporphyrinogen-III C-methyltransferase [Oleiphilus sp.]|nr:MAG: uroporphyrinogen-III C-methyltransferase [Oleiphilus sp.]